MVKHHHDTDSPASPALVLSPPLPPLPADDRRQSYTAHLRYQARESIELEALNTPLPPSAASSRPGSPSPTSPLPSSRQGYPMQERMVYERPAASRSYPDITVKTNLPSRPGSAYVPTPTPSTPYIAIEPDEDTEKDEAHRQTHHPTPLRVHRDPSTKLHYRRPGERMNVKPKPGCCGLCEVSSANNVGMMIGGWLTGVGTFLLFKVAGCCAVAASGLCS